MCVCVCVCVGSRPGAGCVNDRHATRRHSSPSRCRRLATAWRGKGARELERWRAPRGRSSVSTALERGTARGAGPARLRNDARTHLGDDRKGSAAPGAGRGPFRRVFHGRQQRRESRGFARGGLPALLERAPQADLDDPSGGGPPSCCCCVGAALARARRRDDCRSRPRCAADGPRARVCGCANGSESDRARSEWQR